VKAYRPSGIFASSPAGLKGKRANGAPRRVEADPPYKANKVCSRMRNMASASKSLWKYRPPNRIFLRPIWLKAFTFSCGLHLARRRGRASHEPRAWAGRVHGRGTPITRKAPDAHSGMRRPIRASELDHRTSVSVARRHGLSPQQLFGGLRHARESAGTDAGANTAGLLAPAIVESPKTTPPIQASAPISRARQRLGKQKQISHGRAFSPRL
jgi:transposase-like protein